MDLDDLKTAWAAHTATLERSVAINERLLRETFATKTRRALAPYAVARALEVLCGLAFVVLAVPCVVAHAANARYLVAGGGTCLFVAALTALCGYLLVQSQRLDLEGPVTTSQRALAHLQLVEYRATKWAVLGGVVVWLPALLLLFEALTGTPALALVDLAWLVSNLAFGLVVLAIGLVWARRSVEHAGRSPRAQRIIEALSGRSLRRASTHLAELARFVHD